MFPLVKIHLYPPFSLFFFIFIRHIFLLISLYIYVCLSLSLFINWQFVLVYVKIKRTFVIIYFDPEPSVWPGSGSGTRPKYPDPTKITRIWISCVQGPQRSGADSLPCTTTEANGNHYKTSMVLLLDDFSFRYAGLWNRALKKD